MAATPLKIHLVGPVHEIPIIGTTAGRLPARLAGPVADHPARRRLSPAATRRAGLKPALEAATSGSAHDQAVDTGSYWKSLEMCYCPARGRINDG